MIMRPSRKTLGFAAGFALALVMAVASISGWAWRWIEPRAACAEDVMRFEPVPAESVSAMERRRAERRTRDEARRDASVPEPPAGPDAPDAPEPPDAPDAPEYSHAGDVVRIGSDIHIEKGQTVEGDVFALRGDIVVDGHVKGNVAATGGDVKLGSTARVDGDVMCIGGKLEEEDGARVGGQRVTALRGGRHARIIPHPDRDQDEDRDWDWAPDRSVKHLSFAMSWLLVSLLLAWIIGKFAPNRTQVAVDSLKQEPGFTLAIGLGTVLLLVPSVVALALVVAVLCITIIGIPLALGVIVGYAGLLVVLALWGYIVGVMPIGQRVVGRMGRAATPVSMAIFGVLLVSGLRVVSQILHFIPFFGWFGKLLWVVAFLIGAVATLMGAGALLRTKFGRGRDSRWWPLFPARQAASVPGTEPPSAPTAPPSPPPPSAPPGEPSPAA
jgi:hypothetical protein